MKTPKRRHCRHWHWRRFDVFIVNFEHISHVCSSVYIVNFEQVNADWYDIAIGYCAYVTLYKMYKILTEVVVFCAVFPVNQQHLLQLNFICHSFIILFFDIFGISVCECREYSVVL